MRKIVVIIMVLSSVIAVAQTSLTSSEIDELKQMYKENYKEWIISKDIIRLLKENPAIDSIIQTVDIQETLAFQEIKKSLKNKEIQPVNYKLLFNKEIAGVTMDYVKELLDPENTQIITNLYWDIINSNEGKEIGDLVVKHMEKAVLDIGKEIQNFKPPN